MEHKEDKKWLEEREAGGVFTPEGAFNGSGGGGGRPAGPASPKHANATAAAAVPTARRRKPAITGTTIQAQPNDRNDQNNSIPNRRK